METDENQSAQWHQTGPKAGMPHLELLIFQVLLGVSLAISFLCFLLLTQSLYRPFGTYLAWQRDVHIAFWITTLVFYVIFYLFHRANRPYNPYPHGVIKGNQRYIVFLVSGAFFMTFFYRMLLVDHLSWYTTLLLFVSALTYGTTGIILALVLLIRSRR